VTSQDKRFASSPLDTNDHFSFRFTTPGTYAYYCAIHPIMTGQIIVK
jgi:plastocyanin